MRSFLRKVYQASPQQVYRYFAGKRRKFRARIVINRYIASNQIRKLHVGCGGNFFETWLNTDLVGDNKKIAMLDVSKPFPISTSTFDYVYSEHLLEHLTPKQQISFLKESYRILKPGGKIRIATPNFKFLMELAQAEKSDFQREYLNWNARTFLKNIPQELINKDDIDVYVINNYFRDWGHQFIHKSSSLSSILIFSGFTALKFEAVGKSDDPQLMAVEQHGAMITDIYNEFETMIVEGVKPGEN